MSRLESAILKANPGDSVTIGDPNRETVTFETLSVGLDGSRTMRWTPKERPIPGKAGLSTTQAMWAWMLEVPNAAKPEALEDALGLLATGKAEVVLKDPC